MTEQRMRMKWIKTVTCAVILLSFFFSPRMSYAQTESELNFYVTPILPESQLEGGALGYFDLNLGAGERDELALEIENGSDQAIEIEISAHTAFTNVNGVVEYGRDAESPDPTLPAWKIKATENYSKFKPPFVPIQVIEIPWLIMSN